MCTNTTTDTMNKTDQDELRRRRAAYMREYRKTHKSKRDRIHQQAYNREYRKQHPEKVEKWQRDYILRKAAAILAEEAATAAGEGGDGNV